MTAPAVPMQGEFLVQSSSTCQCMAPPLTRVNLFFLCSPVYMGCYGIGVSRLLAAVVEHGVTLREDKLTWPLQIAPYRICIVPMAKVCIHTV